MNKHELFFRGFLAVLFCHFFLQQPSMLHAMNPAVVMKGVEVGAKVVETYVPMTKNGADLLSTAAGLAGLEIIDKGDKCLKKAEECLKSFLNPVVGENPSINNITDNGHSASISLPIIESLDTAINFAGEAAKEVAQKATQKMAKPIPTSVPPTLPEWPNEPNDPDKDKNKQNEKGPLDNANYSQRTYGERFSDKGIEIYKKRFGRDIETIDQLADALKKGEIKPSDLPIDYIVREGRTLIMNHRTPKALERAGIPRDLWNAVNRTGQELFEKLLDDQLARNKLTSEGVSFVRQANKLSMFLGISQKEAEAYICELNGEGDIAGDPEVPATTTDNTTIWGNKVGNDVKTHAPTTAPNVHVGSILRDEVPRDMLNSVNGPGQVFFGKTLDHQLSLTSTGQSPVRQGRYLEAHLEILPYGVGQYTRDLNGEGVLAGKPGVSPITKDNVAIGGNKVGNDVKTQVPTTAPNVPAIPKKDTDKPMIGIKNDAPIQSSMPEDGVSLAEKEKEFSRKFSDRLEAEALERKKIKEAEYRQETANYDAERISKKTQGRNEAHIARDLQVFDKALLSMNAHSLADSLERFPDHVEETLVTWKGRFPDKKDYSRLLADANNELFMHYVCGATITNGVETKNPYYVYVPDEKYAQIVSTLAKVSTERNSLTDSKIPSVTEKYSQEKAQREAAEKIKQKDDSVAKTHSIPQQASLVKKPENSIQNEPKAGQPNEQSKNTTAPELNVTDEEINELLKKLEPLSLEEQKEFSKRLENKPIDGVEKTDSSKSAVARSKSTDNAITQQSTKMQPVEKIKSIISSAPDISVIRHAIVDKICQNDSVCRFVESKGMKMPDFSKRLDGYFGKMSPSEVMAWLELGYLVAKGLIKAVIYTVKTVWRDVRDFGQGYAYLFNETPESNIEAKSLSYDEPLLRTTKYRPFSRSFNRAPRTIDAYRDAVSKCVLQYTGAVLQGEIRALNQNRINCGLDANNVLALLQLPPGKNIQDVQISQISKQRIALAKRAKEEFDLKKYAEAKELVVQAVDLYKIEAKIQQRYDVAAFMLENPGQIIKQEYSGIEIPSFWSQAQIDRFIKLEGKLEQIPRGIFRDKYRSIKTIFEGSLAQRRVHGELIDYIGTTATNYREWFSDCRFDANKSYYIAGLTHFILHFVDLAKIYNNANKIIPAYNLSDFCESLVNFEGGLIEYIHEKEHTGYNGLIGDGFLTFFKDDPVDYFRKRLIDGIENKTTAHQRFLLHKAIADASDYLKKALELAYTNKTAFEQKIIQEAPALITAVEKHEEQAAEQIVSYVMETLYKGNMCGIIVPASIKQALQDAISNEALISKFPGNVKPENLPLLAPLTVIFTEALSALLEAAKENLLNGQIQEQNEAKKQVDKKVKMLQSVDVLDATNKANTFQAIQIAHGQINQLPGLLQTYGELLSLPERGYDVNQCGYYAAHNAKIFASNPGATREQLIDLLNDRNRFEVETLQPGIAMIRSQGGQNSEHATLNLLGEEILQLIPQNLRNQIIVIGAATDNPEDAIASIEDADNKRAAFKAGQLEQLIYILPGDKNTHWFAARVTRGAQEALKVDIVDSLGSDRRGEPAFAEILQSLSASEKEAQAAGDNEASVVTKGYAGSSPIAQKLLLKSVERLKADFTKRVNATTDGEMNVLLTARIEALEKFEKTGGNSLWEQLCQELNQNYAVLAKLEQEYPQSEYVQVIAQGIHGLMKQACATTLLEAAFEIIDLCRKVIKTLERGLALLQNTQNFGAGNLILSQDELKNVVTQALEIGERFLGAIGLNKKYDYKSFDCLEPMKDYALTKLVNLEQMQQQKGSIETQAKSLAGEINDMSWEALSKRGVEIGARMVLDALAITFVDNFIYEIWRERINQLLAAIDNGANFNEQYAIEVAGFAKLNAQEGVEEVNQAIGIVEAHPELLKAGIPFFKVVKKVIKIGRM